MTLLFKIILGVLFLYALLYLFALVMANRMIFPAPPSSYTEGFLGLFFIEDANSDVPPVAAKFYPAEGNTDTPPFTLLYAHGNGEDLGTIDYRLQALSERGFNVLAYDYPGYGLTGGEPSEAATYEAADIAFAHLTQTRGIAPENIILYGRSLGGGPTYYLAQKHENIAGVITESTFTSTFRVMTRVRIMPMDVFDNLARIPEIRTPILLLHGTFDIVVPFSHAKKLLSAAPEGTQHHWFEQAGHNNLVEDFGQDYYGKIEAFRRKLIEARRTPAK